MTPFVSTVTNLLSLGTIALDALAVFLFLLLMTPLGKSARGRKVSEFFGSNAIFFGLIVALASIAASLFYSDFVGFAPCLLCWWQRVLLYPQALLLLIALAANDEKVRKYCIALSGIGVLVSTYHSYLQFGGAAIVPCSVNGVSCEHVYFLTYGYVTIPTMALTAFATILLLMFFKKNEA